MRKLFFSECSHISQYKLIFIPTICKKNTVFRWDSLSSGGRILTATLKVQPRQLAAVTQPGRSQSRQHSGGAPPPLRPLFGLDSFFSSACRHPPLPALRSDITGSSETHGTGFHGERRRRGSLGSRGADEQRGHGEMRRGHRIHLKGR